MTARFTFFAGKGGVGKTTCAAAHAVAEARAGSRVLIVSTDPAHSLGDVFGVPLSSRPASIRLKAPGTIRAVEFDATRAFRRWLRDHRQALADIIEHGTLLDRDDALALLGLSIPGVDELVAVLEIARLAAAHPAPDLVVVDTAPTGHALRLLTAPDAVAAAAGALGELQREHRIIRARFACAFHPEAADRLIVLLMEQARGVGSLLRDRRRAEVHWVMAPERLSLAETKAGLAALARASIHTSEIIINRVLLSGTACPVCDRRRAAEAAVIGRVRQSAAASRALRIVPARIVEPRGVERLVAIGRQLHACRPGVENRKIVRLPKTAALSMGRRNRGSQARLPLAASGGRQVVFVGGKGGVGKTTIAASLATMLARRERGRRVLLFSTDPAHSLGHLFGASVGNRARAIADAPNNLKVRELDANAALAARRALLEGALAEIGRAVGVSGASVGEAGVSELLRLAPPGIDELFGLLSVVDFMAENPDETIVVDTAPTGHTLRLLEMPEVAREWVQVLMRLLLKYKDVVRPGQLATELVELSRSINNFLALMSDPARAEFVVVTRAEEVPRCETERLLHRLRRLRLGVSTVVINAMTLAPGRCSRCRAVERLETREMHRLTDAIRRARMECAIIQTPLAAPPPTGLAALERWASTWIEQPTSIA